MRKYTERLEVLADTLGAKIDASSLTEEAAGALYLLLQKVPKDPPTLKEGVTVTLQYTLGEDPDPLQEIREAPSLRSILSSLLSELRSSLKHETPFHGLPKPDLTTLEAVKRKVYEDLNDHRLEVL